MEEQRDEGRSERPVVAPPTANYSDDRSETPATPEVIDTEEPLEGMNCISTESLVSKLVDPP